MTTTSVGSPTVGLGRFIQESRFIVPSHQRDFSWTDEYVRQFLRDIEEAISSKRESYFCGLMVFTTSSPGVFKVLDGQQRLATTLMLFSAVRNWLGGFSEFDDLRHQVGGYLGITELGATQPEPRLTMTAANNAAYQRLVTSALPLREMEKALKQKSVESRSTTLAKAVIHVNRYVSQRASDFISQYQAREYFVSFLKYMSDQVQVVRLFYLLIAPPTQYLRP